MFTMPALNCQNSNFFRPVINDFFPVEYYMKGQKVDIFVKFSCSLGELEES